MRHGILALLKSTFGDKDSVVKVERLLLFAKIRAAMSASRLLTVSRHGSNIRTIHDTLVLLSQCFDVALAKVEDLLTQHGTVLVAGSLLDGEMQQHHAPDEAEADQEEAQLLRGKFPQERCSHADRTETWKSWTDFDWTGGKIKSWARGIRRAGEAYLCQLERLRQFLEGGMQLVTVMISFFDPSSPLSNISGGRVQPAAENTNREEGEIRS